MENNEFLWVAAVIISLNTVVALLFWLHERLETGEATKLRLVVEAAVRTLELVIDRLGDPQKKEALVARVQAFMGFFKWLIPPLVIDSAIGAELFVIKQLHKWLSVDHDTPMEGD